MMHVSYTHLLPKGWNKLKLKREQAGHAPMYQKQLVWSTDVIYKTSNNSVCEYRQHSGLHTTYSFKLIIPKEFCNTYEHCYSVFVIILL